jgi:hypothetical protein
MTPTRPRKFWAFSRNSLGKEQGIIFPDQGIFKKGIRDFSDPYRETHLGGAALRSPALHVMRV